MEKTRVLYVSQEIKPFLSVTEISDIVHNVPQGVQDEGKEIRVFMPRFGCINERRHQLHEVIRLSGMNLIINDTDHPLIIKVASVPGAKMQVYFIDNEEYFKRKSGLVDASEKLHADNDERAMFFCRGVLETVKKLGWVPDVIHCNGWFTSPMGLYIKKMYKEDPHFADTKVVYSLYNNEFEGSLDSKMAEKLTMDGFDASDVKDFEKPTYENLMKASLKYADGVIKGSENLSANIDKVVKDSEVTTLEFVGEEERAVAFNEFYDKVLEESSMLVD